MLGSRLINEGSRDELLNGYLAIVRQQFPEATLSMLKKFLLNKFVNEAGINNLSLRSNYYLSGVAKYYFNGDLTRNKKLNVLYDDVKDEFIYDKCQAINDIILYLRNKYIDTVGERFEQPEDFGDLSFNKLIRKYINKARPKVADPVGGATTEPESNRSGNYTYRIMYSYNDCRQYKNATSPGAWCITYGEQHYQHYCNKIDGKCHFVVFEMDGYEKVPRRRTQGWTRKKPQDAYGNSLIALLQRDRDGSPVFITSRWNHGTDDGTQCEADHAYTPEEFMSIVGVTEEDLIKINETYKANKKQSRNDDNLAAKTAVRDFKYIQMLLNDGQPFPAGCKFFNFRSKKLEVVNHALIDRVNKLGPDYAEKITKRILSKSIIGLAYNGFVCIVDNGSIVFDSIVADEFPLRPIDRIGESIDNLYGFLGIRFGEKMKVYDYIHHRMLNVDGVTKFRPVDTWQYNKKVFLVSANGKMWAMINKETGLPIQLPNGSYWCEEVSWGYSTSRICEGDGFVRVCYDSSAREYYYLNITHLSFVDVPDGYGACNNWRGRKLVLFIKDAGNRLLYLKDENRFFSDKPEKYVVGGDIAYIPSIGKIIDFGNNKVIAIPDGDHNVTFIQPQSDDGFYFSIQPDDGGYAWSKTYIYNSLTNKFYRNPWTNGFLFRFYGEGSMSGAINDGDGNKGLYVYTPNGDIYRLPSYQQMADGEKQDVKESFFKTYKRLFEWRQR